MLVDLLLLQNNTFIRKKKLKQPVHSTSIADATNIGLTIVFTISTAFFRPPNGFINKKIRLTIGLPNKKLFLIIFDNF